MSKIIIIIVMVMVFLKCMWTMGSFLLIKIKSRTFRRKPESGSFRSSVVSASSFRPESLWLIFGLFGLDLIHMFRTWKKTYGALGVYYHVYN